jgi:hypothetical protein
MKRAAKLGLFGVFYPALYAVILHLPLYLVAELISTFMASLRGLFEDGDIWDLLGSYLFIFIGPGLLAIYAITGAAQLLAHFIAGLRAKNHLAAFGMVTFAIVAMTIVSEGILSEVPSKIELGPLWVAIPLLFTIAANWVIGLKQIAARPDDA